MKGQERRRDADADKQNAGDGFKATREACEAAVKFKPERLYWHNDTFLAGVARVASVKKGGTELTSNFMRYLASIELQINTFLAASKVYGVHHYINRCTSNMVSSTIEVSSRLISRVTHNYINAETRAL